MKILYVSDSVLPSKKANSVHVMKMCEAFSKAGVEIILIASKINKSVDLINKDYSINSNFPIYGNRKFNRFLLFFNLINAVVNIRKIKPDVIYSRSVFSSLSNLLFRRPLYLEIHKKPSDLNRFNELAFHLLLKFNSITKLIVISEKLKQLIKLEISIHEDDIEVLHDGATIEDHSSLKTNFDLGTLKTSRIKVGYVGTIGQGRGIELINELSKEMKDKFTFYIVGGDRSDLIKMGINQPSENLHCLGFMNYKQANYYCSNFDILLAPYNINLKLSSGINTIEYMSPLKIFEYMSLAKPIIVSDLSVLHEVLDSKSAMFAGSNNLEEWKSCLYQLENIDKRTDMGKNAYDLLNRYYTWDKRVEKIINMIHG